MRPIFLPKVHTATKLATQVRIPPPAPQASHFTDCGAPRTPGAQEGHPLPRRLTRPRRPLPLYGTFSTGDWALAVAKEAERHAAEVADGAAGGLDLCGCAGHRGQRPPDRCPLNRVVKFKRRLERRCVGRLSGSAFSTPSCRCEHRWRRDSWVPDFVFSATISDPQVLCLERSAAAKVGFGPFGGG